MSEKPNGPGRARDDTRQRILGAARSLFAIEGFDNTTVRQIAHAVGLTDAALYYHFKSKREILDAIWDLPVDGGVSRHRADGQFTHDQLDRIIDSAVDFTIANDRILRLMAREILRGDQTALALRQQSRSVMRRTLREHFLTIVDQDEADIRTEALVALLTGSSMRTQLSNGSAFPTAANEGEYRERTRRWARTLARLDERQAG
jgi:AcrR family transcriptional regulator